MKFNFFRKIKNTIHPPTTVTWSRVIETFEALPVIYQPYIRKLQAETGEFPYIVFTPAAEKSIRKTPEQALCATKDCLYFLENLDKNLSVTAYPLSQIRDVESGAILLFSWLTVHGITLEGENKSHTIEFNSVSYPHFIRFINMARAAPQNLDAVSIEVEKSKFDYLYARTYKFMNYGRRSLKGDESVLTILWEPEIREKTFARLWLPFYNTRSCAHLTILTDKELIHICEDEMSPLVKGNRYGGVWRYIPHSSLRSMTLCDSNPDLINLTIRLKDETDIQLLFRAENRPGVEELVRLSEEILGREAATAMKYVRPVHAETLTF